MKAAIQAVRTQGAAHIVAAVPVGPQHTVEEISSDVDEIICLSTPAYFMAVGQFYDSFEATEDDEVIDLLSKVPFKPAAS
jgi:putative phosphoribosyl transferase